MDLIDELLERDAGTVNSTIIGKPLDSGMEQRINGQEKCLRVVVCTPTKPHWGCLLLPKQIRKVAIQRFTCKLEPVFALIL